MRLLFVFIFSFFHFFARTRDNGQMEYEFFCNTSSPTQLFTTLAVSNNVSVYQEKYSTAQAWTEKTKSLPEGGKRFGLTDTDEPYFKIDRSKKEFFSLIG